MLAQQYINKEEENGFGYFVGLDETDPAALNDCIEIPFKEEIKCQKSTETKLCTLSTAHSSANMSIVSAELIGTTVESTTIKNNGGITDEIGQRIDDSHNRMMDVMKSLFNEVLEGQKKINNNLDKLSTRIDYIEQTTSMLSLSSNTAATTCCSSPGIVSCPSVDTETTEVCSYSESKIDFLRKVKISGNTFNEVLKSKDIEQIAKLSKTKSFHPGQIIAREDDRNSTFFMIKDGYINCYKESHAQPMNSLSKGEYFGDEDVLKNTYIATTSVTCLCLPHSDYIQIFGVTPRSNQDKFMNHAEIDDFEVVRVLGTGNFSTVKLAKYKYPNNSSNGRGNDNTLFALKCFKSSATDDPRTVKEVIANEKRITSQLESQFIVQFFGTIKSNNKLYFILEAMLGGDLYSLLDKKRKFNEDWMRFYAASVACAFKDIHAHNIAYRDLKPENLILTNEGHIKIVDFGLAKKLDGDEKTYTCCGTLDYLAPEIVLKSGHNMLVDYWALGILMYEMAAGVCPFLADDQIKTCRAILSGKIDFPSYFSPTLRDIIRSLLQKDPAKRLGFRSNDDIKNHTWFSGFDWDGLVQRKLRAPYVPKIANEEKIQEKQQRDIYAEIKSKGGIGSFSRNNSNKTGKNLKSSMFGGYY